MAKAPERADGSPFYPADDMKHPDPKKHQVISFVKSGVRIAGSVIAMAISVTHNPTIAVLLLAGFYGAAESIGIYEEMV